MTLRQAEVREHAEALGHVLHRDDRRRGRWSVICTRCGSRAEVRPRGLVGTLLSAGECFPEPGEVRLTRRQREIRRLDVEDGWADMTPAAEANWAARGAWAMRRALEAQGTGGRVEAGVGTLEPSEPRA